VVFEGVVAAAAGAEVVGVGDSTLGDREGVVDVAGGGVGGAAR
jgi:hypothetical protein